MTGEKVKSVLQLYFDTLKNGNAEIQPRRLPSGLNERTLVHIPEADAIAHLLFMCQEAQIFINEDRIDKAMRWLGFIQGVLWSGRYFSIEALKQHSTSEVKA
jgi:hypothetical protein